MKRRHFIMAGLAVVASLAAALLAYGRRPEAPEVRDYAAVERAPRMRPDYSDTVFPPNIAAPGFVVEEQGTAYLVKVCGERGDEIEVFSREPGIALPLGAWRKLLNENRGGAVEFDVYVQSTEGDWRRFKPIRNAIAEEEIDPYIVYRQINVIYNLYRRMQIRQRCLEDYADSVILDNGAFGNGCVNCHTFLKSGTDHMLIQMRSGPKPYGAGMLLIVDGKLSMVDTRTEINPGLAAFSSWHPSGRAVAFSINRVRQFFHTTRVEGREGIDLRSDLALYLLDSEEVTSTKAIARPDRLESWPAWSADGRHLYFASSPTPWDDVDEVPPANYDQAICDLMRIGYDIDTGEWGEVEPVLLARETGMSITLPRPSPDGRYIIVCMSQHSSFPALQPDADLYMVDLATGGYERLPCNSDRSESWHSWSRDGRWFVFSSKAGDGLFLRPYFCYVERDGTVHKPFVLPQRDPDFYESNIKLYQMPELVSEPVPLKGEQIAGRLRSAEWAGVGLPVTAATPAAPQRGQTPDAEPWQPIP